MSKTNLKQQADLPENTEVDPITPLLRYGAKQMIATPSARSFSNICEKLLASHR